MPFRFKRIFFEDYEFDVDETVYEPAEDSFLFAQNLDVKEGERVLDLGTGCGILGILAAKKASWVLSVDLNPNALRCAKHNALLQKTSHKMDFLLGDLLTSLSIQVKFDVILFNAPYVPCPRDKELSWVDLAWTGGCSGRETIDPFIQQLPTHLKRDGRVLLMQSNLASLDQTIERFALCGMHARVVAEHALTFFETLFLIEAKIN